MNLKWMQCTDSGWCSLYRLNLDSVLESGVYIIWKPGNPSQVIRVGQGIVADRLYAHKSDPSITVYGYDLLVTWAPVAAYYRDAVERYLAEQLRPAVGARFPDALPIAVNIP